MSDPSAGMTDRHIATFDPAGRNRPAAVPRAFDDELPGP
ncbi:MAG: hypothetical protein AVDCRST_MAG70-782 [uncultured Thermomicrobiales bacterium]|uniref:Uncharacterized protein n=1 Tax=uncultured Thermomicrobiales bacterium TaxID=1645740 RepID=A0A6J4UH11_9BACT|nr:MAG: hypothetical protein AVDCRST_MAG70-782 [uncultured Thermomicrobiales bacterium]